MDLFALVACSVICGSALAALGRELWAIRRSARAVVTRGREGDPCVAGLLRAVLEETSFSLRNLAFHELVSGAALQRDRARTLPRALSRIVLFTGGGAGLILLAPAPGRPPVLLGGVGCLLGGGLVALVIRALGFSMLARFDEIQRVLSELRRGLETEARRAEAVEGSSSDDALDMDPDSFRR